MKYLKAASFSFLVLVILLSSCKNSYSPGSYDEKLDDIVKGVYFGMAKEDFFTHCWDMNQEGQTHHGTIANMVMYVDSLNFSPKSVINFYPEFYNDKVSEMPMLFYYHAWSPWNKNVLKQDSLHIQAVRFFEMKYGVPFEKKEAKPGFDIYYKTIGPLVIRIYKDQDEMLVKADIKNTAYMAPTEK